MLWGLKWSYIIHSGLGSKKQPVHCLVSHGSIRIQSPPPVDFHQLCSWFRESPEGQVEGIVWHCNDGTLVKVRHSEPRFRRTREAAVRLQYTLSVCVFHRFIAITWDWDGRMGTPTSQTGRWSSMLTGLTTFMTMPRTCSSPFSRWTDTASAGFRTSSWSNEHNSQLWACESQLPGGSISNSTTSSTSFVMQNCRKS